MTRKPGWPDRAAGVLLAAAAGDALGAGYEFTHPRPEVAIGMIGGGPFDWTPGEWTDDTAMTLAVARVTATGADLNTAAGLDAVAAGFAQWYASRPKDIGNQTRQVLSARDTSAAAMTDTARRVTGLKGGNGSLMRTGAVGLAYLDDVDGCASAAARVGALTHDDQRAVDACRLWSHAIRHAVLHGTFEVSAAIWTGRRCDRGYWSPLLDEAESGLPRDFPKNGWVVHALQTAWWAINHADDQRRPAPGRRARAGGAGRRRHRHYRRDRRRAARRPLGCVRGARRLASAAARLAGDERPRPGPAGHPHRLPRSGRPAGWSWIGRMNYDGWATSMGRAPPARRRGLVPAGTSGVPVGTTRR